ncbi:aa3-type cytochrome c oxidase subunit IV [Methylovirgula ligni]|uniref:Aa3 type cytochrome c oxidase subunit IV n=1 Tax=Methylovirgula ligni TaxID=569860 RepID=A0A3D9Z2H4_9HYPH|nr:aa3-type cytochrome c oxidase subunit IV [Methylovirgula ligni]QAY97256.1 aa3-type cytochrome c oxidase subunit IV [Methylovirgula ligni]REF89005.1 aa3 type cytochrome c oxidase subunit IV [Methylovirgula ligni]
MASQLTAAPSDAADFAEHLHTYRLFINGMKYGAIIVALILVVLAIVTL